MNLEEDLSPCCQGAGNGRPHRKGLRFSGSGFRAQGLGFRVCACKLEGSRIVMSGVTRHIGRYGDMFGGYKKSYRSPNLGQRHNYPNLMTLPITTSEPLKTLSP